MGFPMGQAVAMALLWGREPCVGALRGTGPPHVTAFLT